MSVRTDRKRILFHYTSINSLMKILEPNDMGEICLRATNARYFNDRYEYHLGISMLKTSLERYEKEHGITQKKSLSLNKEVISSFATIAGNPFLLSFSDNVDDLTMWRTYGADGKGVAIGFDAQALSKYESTPQVVNTKFIKCAYNTKAILENLVQLWGELYPKIEVDGKHIGITSAIFFNINYVCFSIKRKEYIAEKEFRLCKNEWDPSKIRFLERDGLIIPYVEFFMRKDIVSKIIVGPCVDRKLTTESLKFYLKSKGYPDNKDFLITSNVPYRKI